MNSHTPDPAEEQPADAPRRRGADPLSAATRKRLLGGLLAATEAGDTAASAALVELSLSAERDAAVAETLRALRAVDAKDSA